MPRLLQDTPPWLKRSSPGHNLFARNTASIPSNDTRSSTDQVQDEYDVPPPSRKLAARGSQIFVAVGNELRWSDLLGLKQQYDGDDEVANMPFARSIEGELVPAYRVLRVPVHDDIQQLTLSPNSSYLAIATTHTVYIALLPDPYHLATEDSGPIKLKSFQVGPTTHLVGRSPIVSVLWHPLGVDGSCLTTITEDGAVRLWEFDMNNRMSVNSPATALDLKRLANGQSSTEDYSPSKFGAASFTAELPYMQVSAACYGGTGGSDMQRATGWAASTLWIGTKDGGLYSLCPLVPSKFTAPPKLIDELAESACLSAGDLDDDDDDEPTTESRRMAVDQLDWINGIEKHHRGDDYDVNLTVYNRPSRPSPVPMLQGPYSVEPDPEALFDITDIFAIPQSAALLENDDDFELVNGGEEENVVPTGVLCVATSDGLIHICFDLQGTEGRWLPANKPREAIASPIDDIPLPELLLVDSLEVDTSPTLGRPMFTADPWSRAAFFVTHSQAITHVSISGLMDKIVEETEGSVQAGGSFRLKQAVENALANEQRLVRVPRPLLGPEGASDMTATHHVAVPSACVALQDSDLGDMVLTEFNSDPVAAQLDFLESDWPDEEVAGDAIMEGSADDLAPGQAREIYHPAPEFFEQTNLPRVMRSYADKNPRRGLRDQVRISPLDLDMLTQAHHVLAKDTHSVNDAVSRLFGRTSRLQTEYEAQIERAHELADKVAAVVEDDADVISDRDEPANVVEGIERRLDTARLRQEELQSRFEALREEMSKLDRRPLNSKEKEWVRQVDEIKESLDEEQTADGVEREQLVGARVEQVQDWKEQLVEACRQLGSAEQDSPLPELRASPGSRRRVGSAAIRTMLERERAMVEATKKKLDELLSTRMGN